MSSIKRQSNESKHLNLFYINCRAMDEIIRRQIENIYISYDDPKNFPLTIEILQLAKITGYGSDIYLRVEKMSCNCTFDIHIIIFNAIISLYDELPAHLKMGIIEMCTILMDKVKTIRADDITYLNMLKLLNAEREVSDSKYVLFR